MKARASSAVIAFPTDRLRRPAAREPGQCGEVVIFSGVRIERMTDEPPPKSQVRLAAKTCG